MQQLINKPVRSIGTSKVALTGRVARNGQALAFESSLERDCLILLSWDPSVTDLVEQPTTIYYQDESGKRRRYTPDCYAAYTRRERREEVLYEVKYRDDLRANWKEWRPKFKAAVHHCRVHGARFKLMTEKEIRTPFLANIKFLRSYLDITENLEIEAHLAQTLATLGGTTPETLLIAAYWERSERIRALPHLWRMIARKRVLADLTDPLTMKTLIWIVVGEGFIWENPRSFR